MHYWACAERHPRYGRRQSGCAAACDSGTPFVGAVRVRNSLGLAGAATDLGEKQVNTEGSVLVCEVALELGNLLSEHIGGIADTADDTEATGIADSSSQLGTGSDVHAGQQHGVLDPEEIGDRGTDLLCRVAMWLALEGKITTVNWRRRSDIAVAKEEASKRSDSG